VLIVPEPAFFKAAKGQVLRRARAKTVERKQVEIHKWNLFTECLYSTEYVYFCSH